MFINPFDDVSYYLTSWQIPAGNGLPAVDVTANDPQGWVQDQQNKRDPNTPAGKAQAETQQQDAIIQDIRRQMQEILQGTRSRITQGVGGATDKVSGAISDVFHPLDSITNIVKGAGVMLVLVLVGVLLLAFGIYQLTKD